MSDLSMTLRIDTGGSQRAALTDWNCTTNCSPMWTAAMPECDGLRGMHELPAWECAIFLRLGIKRMEERPATYRAMNPANGWGDYDGLLAALKLLLRQCEEHPKAIMDVSR